MNPIQRLKQSIAGTRAFQRFIQTPWGGFLLAHFGRWWPARNRDVMASPDNPFIPRVPDAGRVRNGYQVMHNGLRVLRGSYYGYPVTRMLKLNRGVHEPQEERAFAEVLRHVRPGGVMLELGSFWAFYSMWFHQVVPRATCYMVEPDPANLEFGRKNFQLNGMSGTFIQAVVGRSNGQEPGGMRRLGVDDFLAEQGLAFLDILHSDIQGFEVEMLHGAAGALAARRVAYVFISTHGNDLHRQCIALLQGHGYVVLAECDLDDTYAVDGLIVARSPDVAEPRTLTISKKRQGQAAARA